MIVSSDEFKEFMEYFKDSAFYDLPIRFSDNLLVVDNDESKCLKNHKMLCLDEMKKHFKRDFPKGDSPKSVDCIEYKIDRNDSTIKLFLVEFKGGDFDGSRVDKYIKN